MTLKPVWMAVLGAMAISLACPPRASAQETATPSAAPILSILGDVPSPTTLTAADLARLPRASATMTEKDGSKSTYTGVPLFELLSLAKIPQGHDFRGPWVGKCLVMEASDGYRAVFALPELDPSMYPDAKAIIVADTKNDGPLPPSEAPLRLIFPRESNGHQRWVRQIVRMRVVSVP